MFAPEFYGPAFFGPAYWPPVNSVVADVGDADDGVLHEEDERIMLSVIKKFLEIKCH